MSRTAERLAAAVRSSDLSQEWKAAVSRGDADYLAALGIVGSRYGLGGAVMRMHLSGSREDYRRARLEAVNVARRMNETRNWRLKGDAVRRVAEIALAHHVYPVCPTCHGRKFEVAEGAPALSGNICKPCHGTGLRPVQRRWNGEIRDVMEVLARVGNVIERGVTRMMK